MKDPMVAMALTGTSRQERVQLTTDTPVDALITQLPEGEVEHTLLLQAGAWAVYRQAGMQTQQMEQADAPAADETLRECSPEMALLLSQCLSGSNAELLPEVLERMRQLQQRLPFHLLPVALNVTTKKTRAALAPLMGERGRWLGQFKDAWLWARTYLVSESDGLPADAETIWQEGVLSARSEILRRLRAVDTDLARKWLEDVWKQERAEARNDLLMALEVNLASADEPFLEQVLSDRAASVRATAASLLARLPESALNARMRQRAGQMLRLVDGHIVAEPPATFPADWQRDGLVEKYPARFPVRAWWLIQVLAMLEPTFWETHLGASPETLLTLFEPDDPWQVQVIEGWSKAAVAFGTSNWLEPLWSWWYTNYQPVVEKQQLTDHAYREQLLQCMSGPQAERLLLGLLELSEEKQPMSWPDLPPQLPRPWSDDFARTYLRLFRTQFSREAVQADSFNSYANPWLRNLSEVALALPVACFPDALQPWDLPKDDNWHIRHVRQQIQEFSVLVRTRQQIYAQTSADGPAC